MKLQKVPNTYAARTSRSGQGAGKGKQSTNSKKQANDKERGLRGVYCSGSSKRKDIGWDVQVSTTTIVLSL